jgi:glycosyltransferase involved in cell wall biosynthesis
MKRLMKIVFPPGSRRRKKFEKTLKRFGIHRSGIDPMYQLVLDKTSRIQRIMPSNLTIKETPLISIVVPAYNPNKLFFETLVNSVLDQSYENFELIIVDGSNNKKIIKYVAQVADYDPRIRVIKAVNGGISKSTNIGVKAAKGAYVALLDHDDLLHPDALLYVVAMINKHPDGDLFYSDECKISESGEVFRLPHFKPDFSPDLLLNLNYITHLAVIKKQVFESIGLFDKAKDGAQDYDMFLRIADYTKHIYHIPKVLYFWRESGGSTSAAFENKKNLADAGISALNDHFERVKLKVKVKIIKNSPGFYHAKIATPKKRVAVLVAVPNNLFIDNYLEYIKQNTDTKHMVTWLTVKNNSDDINKNINAIREKYDTIIIIIDLSLPVNEFWLNNLVATSAQKHIGIVGPTSIDNFGRVIYKGDVEIYKDSTPLFLGLEHNERTNFGDVNWNRNVDAIMHGIVCFAPDLLPKDPVKNFADLVEKINTRCDEKSLYKTSLGRCYMERVPSGNENFDTILQASRYFNPNLHHCGYYEDFPMTSTTQLPVSNTFNVLVDPNE